MKDCKRIRLPMPQLPEDCKDGIDYLQKLATEGVRCYLAHSEPYCEETLRRVKSELEVIAKGYPEYFIIINELCRKTSSREKRSDIRQGAQAY